MYSTYGLSTTTLVGQRLAMSSTASPDRGAIESLEMMERWTGHGDSGAPVIKKGKKRKGLIDCINNGLAVGM